MNNKGSKRGSDGASGQDWKRMKHGASSGQNRYDYGSMFVKQDASASSTAYANFKSQELSGSDSDDSSDNEELEIVNRPDYEDSSSSDPGDDDNEHVSPKVITSPKGAYKKHIVQTYTSSLEATQTAAKEDAGKKNYTDFAYKMMQKMGYKKGKGLGKHEEGRTDIVEASKQRGRRGLGLKLKGFEGGEDIKWEDEDPASAVEEVDWLPSCDQPVPEFDDLIDCMVQGPEKLRIDDETHFCSQSIIHTMLASKSAFDELDSEEMRQARTRSNPYETIRGAIFLNRAAMKMANMDHVFDRMFTEPKKRNGQPAISGNELLYFADVCAGPGGFSEYVLWKKNWNAKGFGFTLKGSNDFKLEDFFAASPEMFEPYYGVGGLQGDGDIMRRDNLDEFRKFVFQNTDDQGVHFVMADGGFSVEGQENIQEILSKQLLLCQFLCALNVLREGGSFVCKTFDLFTPFSVGLVYLLYRVFDRVTLFKPVTSRPANSERYVVCDGLRPGWHGVRDYFFAINDRLWELKNTKDDILEVVPMSLMKDDVEFFEYVKYSHERLAIVQARALKKIQAFAQNTTLFDPNQADMRKECLRLWGIPGNTRSAPKIPDPMQKFRDLIDESSYDYFHTKSADLDKGNLEKSIKSAYDFRCMISSGERVFILSLGRSHVYKWDGRSSTKWRKLIDSIRLELPKDTLFEAEIVQELKGEGKGQRKIESVHILDVMWLGGVDLRNEHYNVRMSKADMFVKAVFKPSKPDIAPLRTKQVYKMEELEQVFDQLEVKRVKGSGQMPRLCYVGKGGRCLIPSGVYFMKTTQEPWTVALSKSQNKKYFFNTATRESVFEIPKSSIASFKYCRENRYHWAWVDGVKVHQSHPSTSNPSKISREDMLNFIQRFVR